MSKSVFPKHSQARTTTLQTVMSGAEEEEVLDLNGGYNPDSGKLVLGQIRKPTAHELKHNLAKVPANQPFCDEIKLQWERCSTHRSKEKVKLTLERARKSILVHEAVLTCRRDFLQVKGVGDYVANIMMEVQQRLNPESRTLPRRNSSESLSRKSSTESLLSNAPSSKRVRSSAAAAAAAAATAAVDEVGEVCTAQNCQLVLLLDSREVANKDRNFFETQLRSRRVEVEVCRLPLGDVLWAVKHHNTGALHVCCDTIVERKTISDLSSSMSDGRYREQQLRLTRSGLKRVIYLVEGQNNEAQLPPNVFDSALINTRLAGLWVVHTDSRHETCDFLSNVHNSLVGKLQNFIMTPSNQLDHFFAKLKIRTAETVGELFQTMVMKVPGGNADKTRAVTELYPTLPELMLAYENLQSNGGDLDTLVKDITYGPTKTRKLGGDYSKMLKQCFFG
ncbi:hypothetical protein BASA81_003246 [Batrachochytrium salamandrivorans]|nr:hypothetical protein BASA81_003246 [Batrachochytrium salamandrivorans]